MRKIKLTKKQKVFLSAYIDSYRGNESIRGRDKRVDNSLVKKNILQFLKSRFRRSRYSKNEYKFTEFGIQILEENGVHVNPPDLDTIKILEGIPIYDEYLNLVKKTKEAEKLWNEYNNKKYKAQGDASCIGDLIDYEKRKDIPSPHEIPNILRYEEDKAKSEPA